MRALRLIGMETAIVGSQTGDKDDYKQLQEMADPGTIIVDDANPLELAKFCLEKDAGCRSGSASSFTSSPPGSGL